jgi:hypothetical protein
MIQEFQNAAHNDLKLLRAVLEQIDMKHGHSPTSPAMHPASR